MTTEVSRKLEMAARVREFTRAHFATAPDFASVLARFDDLLARAHGNAARQHRGHAGAAGARARREELRRQLHHHLVHYLVAVGTAAARGNVELAQRFKLPATNSNTSVFLTAVKALLAAAENHRELLIREGMAPSLLENLAGMVGDLEAACEAQRTARRDHIGATADLHVVVGELVQQIKVLEGFTRYRFGDDPVVMAEWKAARQVLGQPRDAESPLAAVTGVERAA